MDRLTEKTGGPAFGTVISLDCVRVEMDGSMEYEPKVESGNLTVRDYFAAKAMQGLLSRHGAYDEDAEHHSLCTRKEARLRESALTTNDLVEYAYAVADAMMDARTK